MKNLFKPASFALYLLSIPIFFIVGIMVAKWTGAGEGQMLAGGAIVLGYGVMGSGIGLVLALIYAYLSPVKRIIRTNWVLLVLMLIGYGYNYYQYTQRKKDKEPEQEVPRETTGPAAEAVPTSALLIQPLLLSSWFGSFETSDAGLGFYAPTLFETESLYFYGNPNFEKSIMEHSPSDSITFKNNEYGNYEISTAPPWMVPEHLKLDYGILYFKVLAISADFIEVETNKNDGRSSFVSRETGKLMLWPEFLLKVSSVEFQEGARHTVHIKALESSSTVNATFDFMKPVLIRDDWMKVILYTEDFEKVNTGWIQWRKNGQFQLNYNLLS